MLGIAVIIVHAADLHLDSPLRGLGSYQGAPIEAVRAATRKACVRLCDLCIEQRASLLLVAGDLYDGDWRDFSTGLFFASQMSRLREAGVRVVLLRGNHDAASQITRNLKLPQNVHELSWRRPETITFDDLGVAVHGRSFPERVVTEDLSKSYPRPVDGALNIGMLHTSVDGREGHESYAPCRLEALRDHGYDYWALGHVHKREVLSERPWVVFPGNLQGRHIRETGAKGATVIAAGGGRVESIEHVSLDVVRWAECHVDARGASSIDEVIDASRGAIAAELEDAEGRTLATRVFVRGPEGIIGRLSAARERVIAELQLVANDLGRVYFEKLVLSVRSEKQRHSPEEPWVAALSAMSSLSDEELAKLGEEALADLKQKLPHEVADGPDALALGDLPTLRRLLGEAQEGIVSRAELARSGEDGEA